MINKVSNEILTTILYFLPPTDCIPLRLVSHKLRIIVALRFRREISFRAAENEEITHKLQLAGLWEQIQQHPTNQAKMLMGIARDFFVVGKEIRAGALSVYAAPQVVIRMIACFFSIIRGKVTDFYSEGVYHLEKLNESLSGLDPKASIGNLTQSALIQIREMINFTPAEMESIKTMGKLVEKLYEVCAGVIAWHDKEATIHHLKTEHRYYRLEINQDRIKDLSRPFIKIMKKDIPSHMF